MPIITISKYLFDLYINYSVNVVNSVHGASQLSKDFDHLTSFIDVYLNEEAVKRKIIECSGIHRFLKVLKVLAQQTPSRKSSIAHSNRIVPLEGMPTHATSTAVSSAQSTTSLDNHSQWQALRAGKTSCLCFI